MVTIQELLEACRVEQLEEMLDHSGRVMAHLEFISGSGGVELAKDCEEYWQVWRFNHLVFMQIVAREKKQG